MKSGKHNWEGLDTGYGVSKFLQQLRIGKAGTLDMPYDFNLKKASLMNSTSWMVALLMASMAEVSPSWSRTQQCSQRKQEPCFFWGDAISTMMVLA